MNLEVGVAVNVSSAYKKYAEYLEKPVEELTVDEKRIAVFRAIIERDSDSLSMTVKPNLSQWQSNTPK